MTKYELFLYTYFFKQHLPFLLCNIHYSFDYSTLKQTVLIMILHCTSPHITDYVEIIENHSHGNQFINSMVSVQMKEFCFTYINSSPG